MEPHIINFIKTLPSRDRMFYLLMRSYERDLNDVKQHSLRYPHAESVTLSNQHISQTLRGIAEIYESELLPLIESKTKLPIYDNQFIRNEKAEPSSESILKAIESPKNSLTSNIETKRSLNGAQTVSLFDPLMKNIEDFDEFAENLGPWGSSFSSNSVESLQDPIDEVLDTTDVVKGTKLKEQPEIVTHTNNDSDFSSDES